MFSDCKTIIWDCCMFPDLLWYTNIFSTLWILVGSFSTLGYWLALSNLLDTNLIFLLWHNCFPFQSFRILAGFFEAWILSSTLWPFGYYLALSKSLTTGGLWTFGYWLALCNFKRNCNVHAGSPQGASTLDMRLLQVFVL